MSVCSMVFVMSGGVSVFLSDVRNIFSGVTNWAVLNVYLCCFNVFILMINSIKRNKFRFWEVRLSLLKYWQSCNLLLLHISQGFEFTRPSAVYFDVIIYVLNIVTMAVPTVKREEIWTLIPQMAEIDRLGAIRPNSTSQLWLNGY
jgi:hypothetical protein